MSSGVEEGRTRGIEPAVSRIDVSNNKVTVYFKSNPEINANVRLKPELDIAVVTISDREIPILEQILSEIVKAAVKEATKVYEAVVVVESRLESELMELAKEYNSIISIDDNTILRYMARNIRDSDIGIDNLVVMGTIRVLGNEYPIKTIISITKHLNISPSRSPESN